MCKQVLCVRCWRVPAWSKMLAYAQQCAFGALTLLKPGDLARSRAEGAASEPE